MILKTRMLGQTYEFKDVKDVLAKASEKIAKAIDGKQIVKEIYVKNKIFNIVVK